MWLAIYVAELCGRTAAAKRIFKMRNVACDATCDRCSNAKARRVHLIMLDAKISARISAEGLQGP